MMSNTPQQPKQFVPSLQQLAVRDWIIDARGNLIVKARAGCGKSTLIIYLLDFVRGYVYVGAFNKAIADELNTKVGFKSGVKIGTLHGLGYGYLRLISSYMQSPDSRKVQTITKDYFPSNSATDKRCRKIICEAVSFAKQAGFGIGADKGFPPVDSTYDWEQLCEYYDIMDEMPLGVEPRELISICQKVYRTSIEKVKTDGWIDFDDMLLAPLYYRVITPKFDWMFVDEAQDTNAVRRELCKQALKYGGRMVAVGDDKQAIYGFAGATNDALNLIKAEMKAAELPLSVTYRCSKAVVTAANRFCPDLTAHENNQEGVFRTINHREFLQFEFDQSDAILCRNTRPLIGIAKFLRSRGIQCVVEGVNYGGLVALASKWGEDISIQRMLSQLEDHTQEQMRKYLQPEDEKDIDEEKAERVQEKFEMICDFAQNLDKGAPVYRLLDEMDRVLSTVEEDRRILRLCTIHRSKGREWGRVFLVGPNRYMPSQWAKQDWEKEQEDNLYYVALTRAKQELIEVKVPPKVHGKSPWWEHMYAHADVENYEMGELLLEDGGGVKNPTQK